MSHALQIVADSDDSGSYRWIVLAQDPHEAGVFHEHSTSECHYSDWGAALDAGTLALAAAEGQAYENEAADPVSDADCPGP